MFRAASTIIRLCSRSEADRKLLIRRRRYAFAYSFPCLTSRHRLRLYTILTCGSEAESSRNCKSWRSVQTDPKASSASPCEILEHLANAYQGPQSHLYRRILTSCFLDTVLVPLCTWLYLLVIAILVALSSRRPRNMTNSSSGVFSRKPYGSSKQTTDVNMDAVYNGDQRRRHRKIHTTLSILYLLLVLAQILMCVLEIVRLSLTHLSIGLLPFTFVALITALALRLTRGFGDRIHGWRWANLAVWVALAITNGVKIAQEVKEGTGARKGSKYPMSDEITDVSVMIGVYAALAILEVFVGP